MSNDIEASTRSVFEAIGTVWIIEIFDPLVAAESEQIFQKIRDRITVFDGDYSRFRKDSWVRQIGKQPGTHLLPQDAKPLFDLYFSLNRITGGAFTPLIGDALSSAGYDDIYSFKPREVVRPEALQELIQYDKTSVTIGQKVILDFGAAGKGYLADIIGDLLSNEGISDFLINAGGDIVFRTRSKKYIEIALEHPLDTSMAIGAATIHNQSLCGSAGNRRVWQGYHHILDPRSLNSPTDITAIWVTAKNGLMADGLATALYFVDPIELKNDFEFEYLIMKSDATMHRSSGFRGIFFTTEPHEKIE